jgi:adenylate cyclase class 2
MIEVEIKARITDPEAFEKALTALGFAKGPVVCEQDIYFNGNDRDFRKTDEALRIRTCRDMITDAVINTLTYKGPKLGTESQTRRELEISIEGGSDMSLILSALGYTQVLEVSKHRQMFRQGKITACIDHVDSLGDYLELEKMIDDQNDYPDAVGELYEWLSKLGLSNDSLTRYSYLELLLKQNG